MTTIVQHESAKAQWHTLVGDAIESSNHTLDDELKNYLILALLRLTHKTNLVDTQVAMEYLTAVGENRFRQVTQLRELGDTCLLLSGLFPQRAQKKLVGIGYYVNMGRSSYIQISHVSQRSLAHLYQKLAEGFVILTDILHAMRELNGIPVMNEVEKYKFWSDFESDYARKSLVRFYGVVPFRGKKSF